jgi:hypothetical protein
VLLPPASPRDAIVPVLIDTSRSMRLADADGQRRIDKAAAIATGDLLPAGPCCEDCMRREDAERWRRC